MRLTGWSAMPVALTLNLFSVGTPMLTMGDEVRRTQRLWCK